MESDGGVFKPSGFGFTCSDEAFDIITEIATLLEPIESRTITRGGGGADIGSLMRIRMPGMGINVDGTKYFWYRRTDADTVDKLDPNEVALCVATAYKATNLWFLYDSDEAKPVSADGTSISDTYIQVTDIAIGNFIQESSYTITRIK